MSIAVGTAEHDQLVTSFREFQSAITETMMAVQGALTCGCDDDLTAAITLMDLAADRQVAMAKRIRELK